MSLVLISQVFGSYWETFRQKDKKLPIAKGSNTGLSRGFLQASKAADQSVALCRAHNTLHMHPGEVALRQQQHGWMPACAVQLLSSQIVFS